MAREIASRLLIRGTLTAQTPLHVGGYGTSPYTDLPLAQNGRGEWYVPGTSLTGVIRAWCERAYPDKQIIAYLFGPRMKRGDEEGGHASFVLIEDAVVDLSGKPIEIRDGVGIDRVLGAAAESVKFDRAILPKGARLSLALMIEIEAQRQLSRNGATRRERPESDSEFRGRVARTKAIIWHLISSLQNEELRFGAARTRGLGRIRLESVEINEQTINNRDGILKVLRGAGEPGTAEELQKAADAFEPCKQQRLELEIKWKPNGPLMVKAGYEGVGVDMLPLVSGVDGGVALVLPGSSIKGVLRSHAERIVRTLLDGAPLKFAVRQDFMKQLEVPLVEKLFGARKKPAPKRSAGNGANKDRPQPGLGALSVDDCYARKAMNSDAWLFVERAGARPEEDSSTWELRKAIDPALEPPLLSDEAKTDEATARDKARQAFAAVKEHGFEISHHVAIDRWTGGASDGALFTDLAPHRVEWDEMRLSVDLMRIPEGEYLACLALLLFVLRDLMRNRIRFGFGVNRGMGEIEVEQINLRATNLPDFPESITLKPPAKDESQKRIFDEFDRDLLKRLSDAWQQALMPNTSRTGENGEGI